MNLTKRITLDNDTIVIWIDKNGDSWIEQPFNPNTKENWQSEEDAQAWADNWIEEFNNRPEPTPLS